MQKRLKKSVLLVLWLAIAAKYLLVYLILMGKNQDYYFLAPGIRNAIDLWYYLWLLLALPTLEFCLFAAPLYWALTSATTTLAATTLACVALAALLYYQVASPSDATNGVIQGLLGLGLQGLLWLKIKQPAKPASVL